MNKQMVKDIMFAGQAPLYKFIDQSIEFMGLTFDISVNKHTDQLMIEARHGIYKVAEFDMDNYQIRWSEIIGGWQGKGFGKIVYSFIIEHNNVLISDGEVSYSATRVYDSLASKYGYYECPGNRTNHEMGVYENECFCFVLYKK